VPRSNPFDRLNCGPLKFSGSSPGGHEPLCGESQVAHLPAADDVAERDEQAGRPPGASGGGVFVLPHEPRQPGGRRAEAHGLPRHPHHLPQPRGGSSAVRSPRGGRRYLLHAHGTSLLRESSARTRAARFRPERSGSERILGALQHRLGVPGLRTDALVGEGARTRSPAVRLRRNRGAHRVGRDRS
jgi:hypothetical protein